MSRKIKLFWEREFDDVQAGTLQEAKTRIESENQDYLLNVNEADYIAHLVSEYRVDPLIIDFDGVHASFTEKQIPAEWFPPGFHVYQGKVPALPIGHGRHAEVVDHEQVQPAQLIEEFGVAAVGAGGGELATLTPVQVAALIRRKDPAALASEGKVSADAASKLIEQFSHVRSLHALEVTAKPPCPKIKVLTKTTPQREVPVAQLSDEQKHTELILPMQRDGEKGRIYSCGSIDRAETRKAVQDILEGGEVAFCKRKEIYGVS